MIIINLRDWNVSYDELREWCEEIGAEVYAIVHHNGNASTADYGFEKEEDLVAFKLKFSPDNDKGIVRYKGVTTIDASYYYNPYIPLLK